MIRDTKNRDTFNLTTKLVYSTNPDYLQQVAKEELENQQVETILPAAQSLKVQIDRKQRKGKEVVLITGFIGTESDLEQLCKAIKTSCGVGGTAKEAEILIQGNCIDKVMAILLGLGYAKTKKIGK